ncbi:hypothetical protein C4D60_Mb04t38960 [Musa balbisiana]|uniref:Uncharacterized protein n=1 Tax=Musa balbisiana TaxID=52838 RepID=A0A4S8KHU2_MUSBA|nr:hypothetical protein C4D60_Mb04t38960 [Musa balbisiana]
MALLVPQKPPSSSSPSPSPLPSPSFGDENQGGNPVTSCLYLKPDAERRSLDRVVVLRRIRYRKRVNQFRAALMSFLKPKIAVEKDGDPDAWLHDAFSSP